MNDSTITRRQLANAIRDHLDEEPERIAGIEIDRHRVATYTTPVVALTPEQAGGFLDAIGIEATNVVWLSADTSEVRYITETWDGPEPVHSHTVIEVGDES